MGFGCKAIAVLGLLLRELRLCKHLICRTSAVANGSAAMFCAYSCARMNASVAHGDSDADVFIVAQGDADLDDWASVGAHGDCCDGGASHDAHGDADFDLADEKIVWGTDWSVLNNIHRCTPGAPASGGASALAAASAGVSWIDGGHVGGGVGGKNAGTSEGPVHGGAGIDGGGPAMYGDGHGIGAVGVGVSTYGSGQGIGGSIVGGGVATSGAGVSCTPTACAPAARVSGASAAVPMEPPNPTGTPSAPAAVPLSLTRHQELVDMIG